MVSSLQCIFISTGSNSILTLFSDTDFFKEQRYFAGEHSWLRKCNLYLQIITLLFLASSSHVWIPEL
jgi:hypothetical protein